MRFDIKDYPTREAQWLAAQKWWRSERYVAFRLRTDPPPWGEGKAS